LEQQRPYQRTGSEFLRTAGRAILADEPGLGKTNQLIRASEGRTLVLSPAMLQDVWSEEIPRWSDDPDRFTWSSYSYLCNRVEDKKGRKSLVVGLPRPELKGPWDTVICDESHYLKGRNTNWVKALAKVQTDRLYMGTGTPVQNWGWEIFQLLRFLYPGDKRFTNWARWRDEWFRTWSPPWGGTEIKGLHKGITYEEAGEAWGLPGRWMRRTADEVLGDLPPMTEQTIACPMTPKQDKAYKSYLKDFVAILPDTGHELATFDAGAQHGKLLQLSTGLESLGTGDTGSGKLDMLDLLMQDRTHPTLVFGIYIETVEAIARRLRAAGRDVGTVSSRYSTDTRRQTIREFREGTLDTLVGTVGTMSEGFTLTQADTCIFVERSPIPVRNEQARRRIRRIGQTRPTLSIDLVTPGTVDEGMSKLLREKERDTTLALTGWQLLDLLNG
jgi:SNF2 family DNA or RNA helicase